jgi:hypothetical protein
MVMAADPCEALEQKIGRRVRDDESHRRITEAIAEVAVSALHPARHRGLGGSDPRGMLEDPVEQAARAAVETLLRQLDTLIDSMPRVAIDQLAREQVAADLGTE